MRRVVLVSLLALALPSLPLLLPPASAHATVAATDPPFLGGLPTAPPTVRLLFTEPVDPKASFVVVYDEQLLRRDLGNVTVDPGDPKVLVVPTGHLTRGLYTLGYQTLSAQDGHLERGSIPMSIGVPCLACTTPAKPGWEAWSPASSVQRGLAYAAVAFGLGAGLVAATLRWEWRSRPGLVLLGLGAAAQAWAAVDAPHPLLPILAALLLAAATTARPLLRAALAAGALVAVVATGHAGAAGLPLAAVHAGALLAWIGALAGAWAWLRTDPADTEPIRRLSVAATLLVGVLAVTAFLLSTDRFGGAWPDLRDPYAQVWLAKLALTLVVLALGAATHRRLWRLMERRPAPPARRLRRAVGAEAAVGAAVLLVTALLVALPVPVAGTATSFEVQAWHGDTRVVLRIGPATATGNLTPGDHHHEVQLFDLAGRAVADAAVRLQVQHTQLDLPSLEVPLAWDGHAYAADGTYLGAVGAWDLTVLYEIPGALEQRVLFRVQVGVVQHLHGGIRITDPHFDTGYLNPGDEATIRFGADRLGSFLVHCHPHPWMQMRLTVDRNATAPAGPVTVRILGDANDPQAAMRFDPPALTIPPGTDVRFVNVGDLAHTATDVQWTPPGGASPSTATGGGQ